MLHVNGYKPSLRQRLTGTATSAHPAKDEELRRGSLVCLCSCGVTITDPVDEGSDCVARQ